jgi:hypothetical protein
MILAFISISSGIINKQSSIPPVHDIANSYKRIYYHVSLAVLFVLAFLAVSDIALVSQLKHLLNY